MQLRRRQPPELQPTQMSNLLDAPSRDPIEELSHVQQRSSEEQNVTPLSQSESPIDSMDILKQPSASLALPNSPPQMEQDGTEPLETTTVRPLTPLSYESPDVELGRPLQGSLLEVSSPPPTFSPPSNSVPSSGQAPARAPCSLSPQPEPPQPSFPLVQRFGEAAPSILDAGPVPETEVQAPPSQLPLPPPEGPDNAPSTHIASTTQPDDSKLEASTDDWVVVEEAPSESNASSSGESREEFHLDSASFEYSESDSSFEEITSVWRGGRPSFHADGLRSSPATLETQRRPRSGPSRRTDAHEDPPASSSRTQGLEEHSLNSNPATLSPSNPRRAYEEQLNVGLHLLRTKQSQLMTCLGAPIACPASHSPCTAN